MVSREAAGVLLVTMPFAGLERPAIGISLLKAALARRGVAVDIKYLNWELADQLGVDEYELITDWSVVPHQAFVGEWLFTEAMYGPAADLDARFLASLRDRWEMRDKDIARVLDARQVCTEFVERCVKDIDWSAYGIVGFTSTFEQNIASLVVVKRVKELHPDVVVVMGGANWEGEMGAELHRRFPFVDVVCSGEADESFPAVVDAVRGGGSLADIGGISYRRDDAAEAADADDAIVTTPPRPVFQNLDTLPWPDYDEYFATRREHPRLAERVPPLLLIQTARGCWWGERNHCTFCGLNGGTMTFRSKTPARIVEELRHLRERYGVSTIDTVDEILDMHYFRTLLPTLAAEPLDVQLFYEVKANLTHQQVGQLARGGITSIQPGIESLSDHVLKLMDKGTTALKNVQLLKWCREYGITVYWNLLYGIPGENHDDYAEITRIIEAIWFLDPPSGGAVRLRLDRFSPYHMRPERHGVTNVRASASYRYLYRGLDDAALDRIAYYFDFDYTDERSRPAEYAERAVRLVRKWAADDDRGDLRQRAPAADRVELVDTRPGAARRTRTLTGWQALTYLECDRVISLDRLRSKSFLAGVDEAELDAFLDTCEADRLVVRNRGEVLSLAVHDEPCPPLAVGDERIQGSR
ncbi:MAG TPA: RiPP maturation radical SAM C-methyltransferase [Streptosporangiaceae bacterium]|nr:RiPP maturation radical SAM C-methyltransferase [Streptosporangiaceae bacterium]